MQACFQSCPPKKSRPTKMRKMVCTILLRYWTSFPNTLYYFYDDDDYYYYYCYYWCYYYHYCHYYSCCI